MDERFSRSYKLLGIDNLKKLNQSRVILFGVGGVGSFIAEGLLRGGVGSLDLVDGDTVNITNINRQLIALNSTIGKNKVDVMKERGLDINPNAKIQAINKVVTSENINDFDFSSYDYVIDAIDTVTSKILIIEKAKEQNVKVISCMGAGNKLDPTKFQIADISKTSVCPLAKIMRTELKKRGITQVKALFSTELTPQTLIESNKNNDNSSHTKQTPSSVSFIPSVAGLIIAGEVIKDLIK